MNARVIQSKSSSCFGHRRVIEVFMIFPHAECERASRAHAMNLAVH
jgi:hypothetical protein